MNLRALVAVVSLFSLFQSGPARRPAAGGLANFLARMESIKDSIGRRDAVAAFMHDLGQRGTPLTEDSTVSFVYSGRASRVGVASDLNEWNPRSDTMVRLRGTDFHHLSLHVDPAARFEYKLVVDSTWMLDPANPRTAVGGYGPNSEVRMPLYRPPEEVIVRPGIPRGKLDTLAIQSTILGRALQVIVYRPPGYPRGNPTFPVLYVLDGGEYLSLAGMNVVLDNLIAAKAIRPPVCIFLDPRTDPGDSRTSMRMKDYTMSDSFVTALVTEVRPFLLRRYRISQAASATGIMGASLGGLAAAHAAFVRPDVFGLCAAQSPSFWWQDARILELMAQVPVQPIGIYIDSGILRDAQKESRRARDILTQRGYRVHYEEHPEGHNWFNWRARIGSILRFFWGSA